MRTLRDAMPLAATPKQLAERLIRIPGTATAPAVSSLTIPPSRIDTTRLAVAATPWSWVTSTTARSGDSSPAKISMTVRRVLRVERTGRLVGEHHDRLGDDGPRDRDALLLAARHLHRPVVGAARQADLLERVPSRGRAARAGRGRGTAARSSTLPNTVRCGIRWNCWNTKPMVSPRSRDRAASSSVPVSWPRDLDRALGRAVEHAEQAEHRRLARSRRTDDREEVAGVDLQRHLAQRVDLHLLAVRRATRPVSSSSGAAASGVDRASATSPDLSTSTTTTCFAVEPRLDLDVGPLGEAGLHLDLGDLPAVREVDDPHDVVAVAVLLDRGDRHGRARPAAPGPRP